MAVLDESVWWDDGGSKGGDSGEVVVTMAPMATMALLYTVVTTKMLLTQNKEAGKWLTLVELENKR